MWRDILLIAGFAFAVLMYFGLTPKQLIIHAETARVSISKRTRPQKAYLAFVIVITCFLLSVIILRWHTTKLVDSLFFLMITVFLLPYTLVDILKLKLPERLEKLAKPIQTLYWIAYLAIFIAMVISWDAPVWRKVFFPTIGFAGGFGLRLLVNYIDKRRKAKSPSKDIDKQT